MGLFGNSKAARARAEEEAQHDRRQAEMRNLRRELAPWRRGGGQISGPRMPQGKARRLAEISRQDRRAGW